MTLILGYAAHRYVILASDRMLTREHDGKHRDIANKAVLMAGLMLLGYTGVANLGGPPGALGTEPTSHWICDQLVGKNPSDYVDTLAKATPAAISAIGQDGAAHAYLFVGFATRGEVVEGESVKRIPLIGTLANFPADPSSPGPVYPDHGFRRLVDAVDNGMDDQRLWAVGTMPTAEQLARTRNDIRRYRRRNKHKALGIVECMVSLIRQVADDHPGVGRNVSVTVLPRADVPVLEGVRMGLTGPPPDPIVKATSLFAPAGAIGPVEIPGVDMVWPGGTIVGPTFYYGLAPGQAMPRPDIDGYFTEFDHP